MEKFLLPSKVEINPGTDPHSGRVVVSPCYNGYGTMVVDSVYTPVKDVGYHVEYTRVGDITNYEKLTMNIETNGTISPQDALRQATQILMDHFTVILDAAKMEEAPIVAQAEEVVAEAEEVKEVSGEEGEEKEEKKAKKKKAKK